jgi:hypothetical protein
VNGAEVNLRSDLAGSSSKVEITGGTALTLIGHTVGATSGSNGSATTCLLVDASGVREGHVLSFMTGTGDTLRTIYTAWVKSVSGNTVTFVDPADDLDVTIPLGARVGDYGRVPATIEEAAILMVNRDKVGVGSPQFVAQDVADRIKGEKTDNYSYSLTSRAELTGSDSVNLLLNNYMKPGQCEVI